MNIAYNRFSLLNFVLFLLQNDILAIGPYESEWWAANAKQRKRIVLLAGQLRISKVFTAGPFTKLTLSTFLTVCRKKRQKLSRKLRNFFQIYLNLYISKWSLCYYLYVLLYLFSFKP
jgi:hypothetical protein